MNYRQSFTILTDGKTVTAIDNITGNQLVKCCSFDNELDFVNEADELMETLIEKQHENDITVGDVVSFNDNFDTSYVYSYSDEFVNNLDIAQIYKTRYCYSISHPPLNSHYIVFAIKDSKAYIQVVSGQLRCYLVDTKILQKVY